MKKLLIALASVSALAAVAAPAAAQPYGYESGRYERDYGHDRNDRYGGDYRDHRRYDRDLGERLSRRIGQARQRGLITRREAAQLWWQLRATEQLAWRYQRDGLSRWEREDLGRRYASVAHRLRIDMRDRDYGYGYGGYDNRW